MDTYLVFNTYNGAYVANATISLNMRLSGQITVQWAEPQQRLDSKFVIPKPEERYMEYVEGFTEAEYDSSWFLQSE